MEFLGYPADQWLPFVFAGLMGLSILIYVILDGFDLGVGILVPLAEEDEQDRMIASIGPFWDANETWLVLAIGILLVAFPTAHGMILTALYLPVAIMLLGLIMRGVAFEFRVKAPLHWKRFWTWVFFAGSTMTALSQGYMLGLYIMSLDSTWATNGFAFLTAVFLTVGYSVIGAAWIIGKTEGALQRKAIAWSQGGVWGLVLGVAAISAASPLVSPRIFEKWFSYPSYTYLTPLPVLSGVLMLFVWTRLRALAKDQHSRYAWGPFYATMAIFALSFLGMAYSFYPYVVPEKMTLYEAASAPESLIIILVGTIFVLPAILGYTALSYYLFRGKATELRYD